MHIGITFSRSMNNFLLSIFLSATAACTFAQGSITITVQSHSLNDYFKVNESLDQRVNELYGKMTPEERVAQLIMPAMGRLGQSEEQIMRWTRERKIGGVLMLNGTKEQFKQWIDSIEKINTAAGNLSFLFSADAEPSLVNRKIIGSQPVKKANELQSQEDVRAVAATISNDLNAIGINYNFAPVVDMSANGTVGYRGFGANPANIVPWSQTFVSVTQEHNIAATIKHFPGHGLVSGDTHKSLQVIDGELKELKYYPPLIEKGVLSVMVGHLAVRNNAIFNTNGLPATLSKVIVTDLLRDSLGFQGLIVTDAMNMGGVVKFEGSNWKAIEAGCDILLMPVDVDKAHAEILEKYTVDPEFQKQVEASAKRIIRMKLCLGLD